MVKHLGKKGYFYFVEIMLIVLLVTTFFFLFFPRAEISFQKLQDENNLNRLGYGLLKNLDEIEILSAFIDQQDMSGSNFTALKVYIKSGLPSTTDSKIEYAVNETSCFSEDGALSSCGLNLNENLTKNFNVIRTEYTFSKRPEPITIRLFLWRLL